jgi:gas vesicle protein
MRDNVGSSISYLLVGLGIGSLIGILYAPKSGEETRKLVASKAADGQEYAQGKVRELRRRATDILEQGQEVVMHHKGTISAALTAGKEAYQRERLRVARAS